MKLLLPPSESHLVPSLSKKQNEDASGRKEEDGKGNEHNGMESCTRMKRTVWTVELHQKFVNAVQQLGLDKASPEQIHALMNVEGLPVINVASHLQKYRLFLKKIYEGQQLDMATIQLLLSAGSHFPQTPSTNHCSSFIQQGHHQNSSNSSETYHTTLSPRVQKVNTFQPSSSPLKPLLFPKSNISAFKEDFKSIKEPAIVGDSSLDSSKPRNSFQTASKFPKTDPCTGSYIIEIMTEPYYGKSSRRHSIKEPEIVQESRTRKNHGRVVWSHELHQKFLNAIDQLGGNEKAIPKKIHAVMNVEGLTRLNVATHLQKYRQLMLFNRSSSAEHGHKKTTKLGTSAPKSIDKSSQ
ncbi:unnamed protein product [Arabidopsis arenosa]|uniref:HTH myb-type domain-containing protein n=1 Tax=Arabidopsis arenosa TaxID=38785 RepID=A0A8S2AZP0_ARAAE|nr:unnamed protein product [Arabidopsis arenosa]